MCFYWVCMYACMHASKWKKHGIKAVLLTYIEHGSLINEFPTVALGQIYTRLNLNWHGRPIEQEYETTSTSDTNTTILTPQYKYSSRAFKTTIAITILFKIIIPQLDPNRDVHTSQSFASDPYIHYSEILFLILCAILIARTRTYIRRRYDIQATIIEESIERAPCSCCRNLEDNDSVPFGCDVVEDYAISFLCGPCVLMQMSRHTAPYDTYEGSCCSSNGLPSHAPSMIWFLLRDFNECDVAE